MPKNPEIKKVLVIGSGPIVIGQAAEFDYAGTQACRSLKEEGIEVVLLNSNPATIMTDKDIADRVYIEPLTTEVVEQLIKKEKPDSVLPTLGGQAGLNLAMELEEAGILKANNVRLIGTTALTIKKAEDREMFKETMEKIGEPVAPKLEVRGVDYSYHTMEGETKALSDISFHVNSGEFLCIVGPSGCGKSTLLSLLAGLLAPERGEILLDGVSVGKGASGIGYMLQRDHLFEWRTILSNVSLGLEVRRKCDSKHLSRVKELLDSYGLQYFYDAHPSELSGGMRQRAALIRTLALEPDLLLLDEPFSALDYQTRLSVCDDISSIIRSRKKTAILITHDLSEAVSTADRILVLTNRPGTIKGELVIRFPNHEMSPLKRRNYPEFSSYFNELWKILGNGNGDDTSTVDGAGSGDTDIINGTESGDENPPAARNGLMTAVNVGGEPDEIS